MAPVQPRFGNWMQRVMWTAHQTFWCLFEISSFVVLISSKITLIFIKILIINNFIIISGKFYMHWYPVCAFNLYYWMNDFWINGHDIKTLICCHGNHRKLHCAAYCIRGHMCVWCRKFLYYKMALNVILILGTALKKISSF